MESTATQKALEGEDGMLTLLDIFADDLVPISPNMSNRSTPPANTDFDDQ